MRAAGGRRQGPPAGRTCQTDLDAGAVPPRPGVRHLPPTIGQPPGSSALAAPPARPGPGPAAAAASRVAASGWAPGPKPDTNSAAQASDWRQMVRARGSALDGALTLALQPEESPVRAAPLPPPCHLGRTPAALAASAAPPPGAARAAAVPARPCARPRRAARACVRARPRGRRGGARARPRRRPSPGRTGSQSRWLGRPAPGRGGGDRRPWGPGADVRPRRRKRRRARPRAGGTARPRAGFLVLRILPRSRFACGR